MEINPTVTATTLTATAPELLPIPPKGGDRIFSLSRSSWYSLEKLGVVQLIRIRKPGNLRGRVLIPVERARIALAKLANAKGPTA